MIGNYWSKTDEELISAYAAGDNLAFDALLSKHQQGVFNYIFFIVRNRALAEDIFQDAFAKAIVTIKQGRYVENGKFRAWICRVAHNLVIDHFRQEKGEATISNEDCAADLFNNASLSDSTIEELLVKEQIIEDVKRLIQFLPDNQREVLEMRYYQKLSFKEIADLTGVSINTALGRMRYAILNLRRLAQENKMILTLQ